jgi:hypothetical protein
MVLNTSRLGSHLQKPVDSGFPILGCIGATSLRRHGCFTIFYVVCTLDTALKEQLMHWRMQMHPSAPSSGRTIVVTLI